MYDLVIIGGGPAGAAAGVYAARKRLKTVIVTKDWGGQSTVSPDIQNWIGTISVPGHEWGKQLREHVMAYAGDYVESKEGALVSKIEKSEDHFKVILDNDEKIDAKTVLVGTGSHRRKLEIPGAQEFDHKGVMYCATCDGPLFADKDLVVIGGGNAGFEAAQELLAYGKSVTLLHRSPEFKADKITVEKVLQNEKMTAFTNSEPTEIKGDKFVESLVYKNKETGEEKEIPTQGIFVEIGLIPTTKFAENLVDLNELKQIKIDPWTQRTSVEGIWSAGDCTDVRFHQNNIAAGDGVKALEDIYRYISNLE